MKAAALFSIGILFLNDAALAKKIRTNSVVINNAPAWLDEQLVEKVTDRVENFLEWSTRRVQVYWYSDPNAFGKTHGFGPTVRAIAERNGKVIRIGPQVNKNNFEGVFGHELAHIIVIQKFKKSIPRWLDEGLANYAANRVHVNYPWLAKQKIPNITDLSHPFQDKTDSQVHYSLSTAFMEMVADRCDIQDLLQLSVGKRLVTYLSNTCEIKDFDKALRAWIKKKARKT